MIHFFSRLKTSLKTLRPISLLAFYHGIQHGFYYGFLALYTNWLMVLMVFSVGFYAFELVAEDEAQSYRVFIPIFVGLWSSLFLRYWKRREEELAYTFGVHEEEFSKKQRKEYYGKVKLEEVTNKIIKSNSFTPFKKRLIVSQELITSYG